MATVHMVATGRLWQDLPGTPKDLIRDHRHPLVRVRSMVNDKNTTTTRTVGMLAAVALVAGLLVALAPGTAGALSITVTTTVDGDPGSLRDAVDDINTDGPGPHTINLAAGATYVLDECASGDNGGLTINVGPVTINGNGATIEQTCTDARVFRYNSNEWITLNDVTITGGNREGGSRGAGLKTFGPAEINNSTFVGNDAGGEGGAIWSDDQAVVISNSTFADNVSGEGGGAIFSYDGTVSAENSTFTGNSSSDGGAVFAIEQEYVFVTMVGNDAEGVGGAVTAEVVEAFGSVFADNGTSPCDASLTSNGYNWSDDSECDFGGSNDVVDVGGDPMLGVLADNGGPTETMLPAEASPLVDAVGTEMRCPETDQRGVTRPQRDACDIGAVELEVVEPTTTTTTTTTTAPPAVAAQPEAVTPAFTG